MVTLTPRKRKRILWAANVALVAAIAAAVAFQVAVPVERPSADSPAPRIAPAPAAPPVRKLGDLSAYAVIYERDLGHSAPAEVPEAPPAPALRVIGTVIEPGFASALLLTPEGRQKIAFVGDKVGDGEVSAIAADSITVTFAGKPTVFPVEKGRTEK